MPRCNRMTGNGFRCQGTMFMRREFFFEYPTDSQLVGVGVKGH